jgi:aerobic carbon-monoxide dehydrogenase medium subunit
MKPPDFDYHAPISVGEAIDLLQQFDNTKLLAGGHSLMPMLNMRYVAPDHIVDLNNISELSGIEHNGQLLRIGAMTRQCEIGRSEMVKKHCPLLFEAIPHIGHYQTRNRGTIAGSLCHMDPAAELVCVASALDARIQTACKSGGRHIDFADFPLGFLTPAIAPDEIVTSIEIADWREGHGYAFLEFARRHGDFAIVNCAVLLDCDQSSNISRAAIAIGGLTETPIRITEAEDLLIGQKGSDALFRQAANYCGKLDAQNDIHASAAYRKQLASTLAYDALQQAHNRLELNPTEQ